MWVIASGTLIALAFWSIAWLAPRPGEPAFMVAIGVAVGSYLWAAIQLAARDTLSTRAVFLCCCLAVAWRAPLITLPDQSAHDAVRYVWDARVVRAGHDPYEVRPDDPRLEALHTDTTRNVDASWLPTIYPPVAQFYFLAVTDAHESIVAFRVAALLADIGVMAVLAQILWATGKPIALTLLYAWHPLIPLEGAAGAHVDFVGVLCLLVSWLSLVRGRSTSAALTFVAAVLVKPLPIVLAPLYWRRIRIPDAILGAAFAILSYAVVGHGAVQFGSMSAFVDTFRFNGPVFAMLETAAAPAVIASGAVLAGLLVAVYMRRTREIAAADAWAWPMTAALIMSPVAYPWYLVWLVPLAGSQVATPVWVWTLSVLSIYPTWHLRSLGAELAVPGWLLAIEFVIPAAAVLILLIQRGRPRAIAIANA